MPDARQGLADFGFHALRCFPGGSIHNGSRALDGVREIVPFDTVGGSAQRARRACLVVGGILGELPQVGFEIADLFGHAQLARLQPGLFFAACLLLPRHGFDPAADIRVLLGKSLRAP